MTPDRVVIDLDQRSRKDDGLSPGDGSAPSEDAMVSALVARLGHEYRSVARWHRWTKWDGKRRIRAVTGSVFALIPGMLHEAMTGIEEERATAAAACVAGDTTSATWRTAASH